MTSGRISAWSRFGGFPSAVGGVGAPAGPDFTLSASTVTTAWGIVQVGTLTPTGIDPALVGFRLAEDTNPTGEYAGVAVVNG